METAATELGNPNALGIIGSQGASGQVAALNCQRQGGPGYRNEQQSQSSNENSLTLRDLWHLLVNYGVPGSEIDVKFTKFLLDLYIHIYIVEDF